MPVYRYQLPEPEACGYTVSEPFGGLLINLHKDFETKRGSDRWAFALVGACVPPFTKITVDCSGFVILSSTAIAGMVHLADKLTTRDQKVTLKSASDRIEHTMRTMRLDHLFEFE